MRCTNVYNPLSENDFLAYWVDAGERPDYHRYNFRVTHMKKLALSLALLTACGAAFAQATATGVRGLVTATSGNQLINVTTGTTVPAGATVSATGNGAVTLSMPGCTANLGPGQSMVVTPQACQQFVAANPPGTGAGAGAGGSPFALPGNALWWGAGGAALLAANVNRNRNNNNNNNNAPASTPVTPPAVAPVVVVPPPVAPVVQAPTPVTPISPS
jgi:hypothetical protein